ncbi:MAG: hypothetical protein HRU75_02030 [Planctomycetia bacterium]|nr:MAG: hypothetical protein HRU75_02030 [Planctomycetia bacterium]
MTRLPALLLLLAVASTAFSQGRIDLKVRSIGYPVAADVDAAVLRDGQWTPIRVEVTYDGPAPLQGELRIDAPDLDGDVVSYIESPLVLTPGAGPRVVWCYAVVQAPMSRPLRVSFYADGARLAGTDSPTAAWLPNRKHLILDISDSAVVSLRRAALAPEHVSDLSIGVARPFVIEYVVASMSCEQLPDRWIGLESVDTLVWDDPDPTRLSDAQLDAIKTWVRHGGRLVLGAGDNWQKLARSPLADLLPFDPAATSEVVRSLPQFLRQMAGEESGSLPREITIVAARRLRPGALRLAAESLPRIGAISLISMGFHGSGRVIASAAPLRVLAAAARPETRFLRTILDALPAHPRFLESERSQAFAMTMARGVSTHAAVTAPTQFTGAGRSLLYLALLFVLIYAVAAVGSYAWLRRRGLAHLSWSVFAGFAVAGGVLSLAMVGASRGFSRGVKATGIIDIDAGTSEARGAVWFGYSSPTRQFVDLSLTGAGSYLRSMTRSGSDVATYATPERYASLPGKGLLRDAPMRATLKQFEGYWTGQVRGALRSEVQVNRGSGRIDPAAWVRNDLDVPTTHGFLLYLDPRVPANRTLPPRATDYAAGDRRRPGTPPADLVLVVPLPALKPGETVKDWARPTYVQHDAAMASWDANPQGPRPDLPTLFDWQARWSARSLGDMVAPVSDPLETLLLSTRAIYQPVRSANPDQFLQTAVVDFEGVVSRDISHWLARGYGVLLLLSPTPPPAVLQRDGEPMPARDGFTLYRVRIPISYVGTALAGDGAAEEAPPQEPPAHDAEIDPAADHPPGENP